LMRATSVDRSESFHLTSTLSPDRYRAMCDAPERRTRMPEWLMSTMRPASSGPSCERRPPVKSHGKRGDRRRRIIRREYDLVQRPDDTANMFGRSSCVRDPRSTNPARRNINSMTRRCCSSLRSRKVEGHDDPTVAILAANQPASQCNRTSPFRR
jgi:hypothetical protein